MQKSLSEETVRIKSIFGNEKLTVVIGFKMYIIRIVRLIKSGCVSVKPNATYIAL